MSLVTKEAWVPENAWVPDFLFRQLMRMNANDSGWAGCRARSDCTSSLLGALEGANLLIEI
jgi:hypothetical protein